MYEAPALCGTILAQVREGDPGPGLALAALDVHRDAGDVVRVVAQVLGEPEHDVVALLPLDHLREGPAADRDLDHFLDVGDVHAVASAGPAVDLDLEVGLADDVKDADVLDAADAPENVDNPLAGLLERGQVGADELDGVGSLDAREGLVDVVADELREVEAQALEVAELRGELLLDLLAGHPLSPFLHRAQRHVEFQVEEAGDVRPVVGAPDLGHHAPDLGDRGDDLAEPRAPSGRPPPARRSGA